MQRRKDSNLRPRLSTVALPLRRRTALLPGRQPAGPTGACRFLAASAETVPCSFQRSGFPAHPSCAIGEGGSAKRASDQAGATRPRGVLVPTVRRAGFEPATCRCHGFTDRFLQPFGYRRKRQSRPANEPFLPPCTVSTIPAECRPAALASAWEGPYARPSWRLACRPGQHGSRVSSPPDGPIAGWPSASPGERSGRIHPRHRGAV